ncbi:MAG: glycoside hydrolase family 28 protein [Bacteroidaceae bacterium]
MILPFFTGCKADNQNNLVNNSIYNNIPFQMPKIKQPNFPNYEISIKKFGAIPDGNFLNTQAINDAIRAVSNHGGGKVIIPEGLWLTGPIVLQSNVNLFLEHNALVLFTDDYKQYPIVKTIFEGLETYRCQSPISANGVENIAITGYGIFDGNGDSWRPVKKDKLTESQWKSKIKSGGIVEEKSKTWYPTESSLKGAKACTNFNVPDNISTTAEWESIRTWLRPVMLNISKSKKVLLEGVTFKNSPCWCLHPISCEDIMIIGVKVINPWYSQNGDALDLESCKNALIANSLFDAGDDAICIKSGKDADGRKRGEPCQNVIVKNNTVLHGHGGFVVGSEMSGGVKNIFVENCTFLGTDVGIRFKSTRGRGGTVEGIYIDHINMINIPNEALLFNLFYGGKDPGQNNTENSEDSTITNVIIPPITDKTPIFKDIHISNIVCNGAGRAMYFNGLPEMPIKNITVKNVIITNAKKGAYICNTNDIVLENISIDSNKDNPNLFIKKSKNVKINGVRYNSFNNKGENLSFY